MADFFIKILQVRSDTPFDGAAIRIRHHFFEHVSRFCGRSERQSGNDLAEVPSKELNALKERAVRSGFDFIDFWAVDFDYRAGQPFKHHWQAYRTRKDRKLVTVSAQEYSYPKPGIYTACVKVIDTFGCDTSITVEVLYER